MVSIALPVFIFLVDFFYRLHPVIRVISINSLFVIGLGVLLSNLPASRIKKYAVPLEDQYLVGQAEALSRKMGTGDLDIYVMDLDRFRIANAGQVGARKYSVFISSYLIKNLTPEENIAVIAHEFAHAKQKHVLKNALLAWFTVLVAGNLLILPIDVGIHPLLGLVFPTFGFLFLFIGTVVILPGVQRRFETQADLIAASMVDGNNLISALEKITKLNMTPGDLSRYWNMNHPSTMERVKRIHEYSRRNRSA